jgi:hypothetical protein
MIRGFALTTRLGDDLQRYYRIVCERHPRYKLVTAPKSDCPACGALWRVRQKNKFWLSKRHELFTETTDAD